LNNFFLLRQTSRALQCLTTLSTWTKLIVHVICSVMIQCVPCIQKIRYNYWDKKTLSGAHYSFACFGRLIGRLMDIPIQMTSREHMRDFRVHSYVNLSPLT
jgi:hypothetical protein